MHNERCKNCKRNVELLLRNAFENVETNYNLTLPSRVEGYKSTDHESLLSDIFEKLTKHRSHDNFIKVKNLPNVDYYIPSKGYIIEFDESQHFTIPRDISLGVYPKEQTVGFSVDRWRRLCQELRKKDNDPPYRDEQRAWFDTLRDFAPLTLGRGQTMRLFARDYEWCSLNPAKTADVEKFFSFIDLPYE